MEVSSELIPACPILLQYSREDLLRVDKQIRAIKTDNPDVVKMIDDYRKLRAACRILKHPLK